MARKKQNGGDAAAVLVIALIFGLAIIGPIAALVWWIMCEMKAKEVAHITSVGSLLATEPEQRRLTEMQQFYDDGLARQNLIDEWAQANAVRRNINGEFDARTAKGRECRQQMDAALADCAEAKRRADALQGEIGERVEFWLSRKANQAGARAGALLYVPLFVLMLLFLHNGWLAGAATTLIAAGVVWACSAGARRTLLAQGEGHPVGHVAPDTPLLTAS